MPPKQNFRHPILVRALLRYLCFLLLKILLVSNRNHPHVLDAPESGAKDARTPNASRLFAVNGPRGAFGVRASSAPLWVSSFCLALTSAVRRRENGGARRTGETPVLLCRLKMPIGEIEERLPVCEGNRVAAGVIVKPEIAGNQRRVE